MERLSAAQVREFNDPRAFATTRSEPSLETQSSRSRRLATDSLERSYSLLLGGANRLEELSFNLQSMLDLAEEGASQRNLPAHRYDELYGKLRSLSAGFDQVVQATEFDGKAIFDGREIVLHTGAQSIELEGINLAGAGEDSLDLIKQPEGARVFVSYDLATQIRNQNTGLTGLDIAEARGIPRTDGLPELADGKYQAKITYQGPESTVELRDAFGGLVERLEQVDLSGNGTELVSFKAGVQLEIEKTQLLESFDKWDWENDGPVSLYADLDYEHVFFHELQDGNPPLQQSAEASFLHKADRVYDSPAMNLLKVEPNGVGAGQVALDAGTYQLKLKLRSGEGVAGAASVAELYDTDGRLVARRGGLDFSSEGKHRFDMGVGLRFEAEIKGPELLEDGKTIQGTVQYTPSDTVERDFDFEAYAERLRAARETVDTQLEVFAEAELQVLQLYQNSRSGASAAAGNGLAASGGIALGLISGRGDSSANAIFNAGAASAQLSVTGMQLLNTTAGLGTQGNIDVTALLGL